MVHLGVNIDHVATIRQARRTYEPDPVLAAALAEQGGADVITIHLREDRRHIQDRDLHVLRQTVAAVPLNLELACNDEIVDLACNVLPDQATLVPERREEVTTEGGLDIASSPDRVEQAIKKLRDKGIIVSLFLDPDPKQLEWAAKFKADAVELHTGTYALAKGCDQSAELDRLRRAGQWIVGKGMRLHAGHGLNYQNVGAIATIPSMRELNIGHSIIARAVFVGLREAVAQMKLAIENAVR
jgi:pyridoxine 5-phosphate synthase